MVTICNRNVTDADGLANRHNFLIPEKWCSWFWYWPPGGRVYLVPKMEKLTLAEPGYTYRAQILSVGITFWSRKIGVVYFSLRAISFSIQHWQRVKHSSSLFHYVVLFTIKTWMKWFLGGSQGPIEQFWHWPPRDWVYLVIEVQFQSMLACH